METYLNLMLIRFGIIAAAVVFLVIVLFAIALILRRRGKLGAASRSVAPVLKRYADARARQNQAPRPGGTRRRADWVGPAARMAGDLLEKHGTASRHESTAEHAEHADTVLMLERKNALEAGRDERDR